MGVCPFLHCSHEAPLVRSRPAECELVLRVTQPRGPPTVFIFVALIAVCTVDFVSGRINGRRSEALFGNTPMDTMLG